MHETPFSQLKRYLLFAKCMRAGAREPRQRCATPRRERTHQRMSENTQHDIPTSWTTVVFLWLVSLCVVAQGKCLWVQVNPDKQIGVSIVTKRGIHSTLKVTCSSQRVSPHEGRGVAFYFLSAAGLRRAVSPCQTWVSLDRGRGAAPSPIRGCQFEASLLRELLVLRQAR